MLESLIQQTHRRNAKTVSMRGIRKATLSHESNAPTTWPTPMCPLLLLKTSVLAQTHTAHSRMKKFEAKMAEKHVSLQPSSGLKKFA